MPVAIAIPEPTSCDAEYNARSLPPYLAALQSSGATPVVITLKESQDRVADLLATTAGVLLPGSRFDVDPERYGQTRIAACGPADHDRAAVDELLLQDAFNLRKPVLAICHGMQTLNVWLNGTLIQDLPSIVGMTVNHAPGRDIAEAHPIQISAGSLLNAVSGRKEPPTPEMVNSSHHQAISRLGDRLRASAISVADTVVEAVESDSPAHFVLAVQWHPERTFTASPLSQAIFRAFVQAAAQWHPIPETVADTAG